MGQMLISKGKKLAHLENVREWEMSWVIYVLILGNHTRFGNEALNVVFILHETPLQKN